MLGNKHDNYLNQFLVDIFALITSMNGKQINQPTKTNTSNNNNEKKFGKQTYGVEHGNEQRAQQKKNL